MHIFMFLKIEELLDLGHDELSASRLCMVIQFVCHPSLWLDLLRFSLGQGGCDYKSSANGEDKTT